MNALFQQHFMFGSAGQTGLTSSFGSSGSGPANPPSSLRREESRRPPNPAPSSTGGGGGRRLGRLSDESTPPTTKVTPPTSSSVSSLPPPSTTPTTTTTTTTTTTRMKSSSVQTISSSSSTPPSITTTTTTTTQMNSSSVDATRPRQSAIPPNSRLLAQYAPPPSDPPAKLVLRPPTLSAVGASSGEDVTKSLPAVMESRQSAPPPSLPPGDLNAPLHSLTPPSLSGPVNSDPASLSSTAHQSFQHQTSSSAVASSASVHSHFSSSYSMSTPISSSARQYPPPSSVSSAVPASVAQYPPPVSQRLSTSVSNSVPQYPPLSAHQHLSTTFVPQYPPLSAPTTSVLTHLSAYQSYHVSISPEQAAFRVSTSSSGTFQHPRPTGSQATPISHSRSSKEPSASVRSTELDSPRFDTTEMAVAEGSGFDAPKSGRGGTGEVSSQPQPQESGGVPRISHLQLLHKLQEKRGEDLVSSPAGGVASDNMGVGLDSSGGRDERGFPQSTSTTSRKEKSSGHGFRRMLPPDPTPVGGTSASKSPPRHKSLFSSSVRRSSKQDLSSSSTEALEEPSSVQRKAPGLKSSATKSASDGATKFPSSRPSSAGGSRLLPQHADVVTKKGAPVSKAKLSSSVSPSAHSRVGGKQVERSLRAGSSVAGRGKSPSPLLTKKSAGGVASSSQTTPTTPGRTGRESSGRTPLSEKSSVGKKRKEVKEERSEDDTPSAETEINVLEKLLRTHDSVPAMPISKENCEKVFLLVARDNKAQRKWRMIGRYLLLSDADLVEIQKQFHFNAEKCLQMLKRWMFKTAAPPTSATPTLSATPTPSAMPTYYKLVVALINAQQYDIISPVRRVVPPNLFDKRFQRSMHVIPLPATDHTLSALREELQSEHARGMTSAAVTIQSDPNSKLSEALGFHLFGLEGSGGLRVIGYMLKAAAADGVEEAWLTLAYNKKS